MSGGLRSPSSGLQRSVIALAQAVAARGALAEAVLSSPTALGGARLAAHGTHSVQLFGREHAANLQLRQRTHPCNLSLGQAHFARAFRNQSLVDVIGINSLVQRDVRLGQPVPDRTPFIFALFADGPDLLNLVNRQIKGAQRVAPHPVAHVRAALVFVRLRSIDALGPYPYAGEN